MRFTVSETKAQTYPAHKQRVKCVHYENGTLYSASSTGEIKSWSVNDDKLQEMCSANASCRVTCVTLNRQSHLVKKEETDEENEEENESKNEDSDISENDAKVSKSAPKRKAGAFVTISYDDVDNAEGNNETTPANKAKKKKRNKRKNKNTE